jgi:signal peptidase I
MILTGIVATSAVIVICTGLLALMLIRRRVILVTVRGQSMAPAYTDGERLVIVRRSRYAPGDVVMFRTPIRHLVDVEWMVKRAAAGPGDTVPCDLRARIGTAIVPAGKLLVRSDAADGIDSRHFGLIDACDVIGVARSAGYLPYSAAKRRISSCNS